MCLEAGLQSPVCPPGVPLPWESADRMLDLGVFQDHPAAGQRHHHSSHHPQPGPGPLVSRWAGPPSPTQPLCHLNPTRLCPGVSCTQTRWTTPGGPTGWMRSSRRYGWVSPGGTRGITSFLQMGLGVLMGPHPAGALRGLWGMFLAECVSDRNALLPSSPPPRNFHPGPGAHQPNDFCRHRTTVEQETMCWCCGSWLCPTWDSTFSPACPEMGVHCDLSGTCEAGMLPLLELVADDPFENCVSGGIGPWF